MQGAEVNKVVDLGEYRFSLMQRRAHDKTVCQHKNMVLDDNGNIVTCKDCGKQIDPYFALRTITEDWGKIQSEIDARRDRLRDESAKSIHLLAAREVERAWRDKRHVPTCPHCGEGISAHDGFGRGLISKQIDDARRLRRNAQKKHAGTDAS